MCRLLKGIPKRVPNFDTTQRFGQIPSSADHLDAEMLPHVPLDEHEDIAWHMSGEGDAIDARAVFGCLVENDNQARKQTRDRLLILPKHKINDWRVEQLAPCLKR